MVLYTIHIYIYMSFIDCIDIQKQDITKESITREKSVTYLQRNPGTSEINHMTRSESELGVAINGPPSMSEWSKTYPLYDVSRNFQGSCPD